MRNLHNSQLALRQVSLVLPDTVRIPDALRTCIAEDSDYYRINAVNVLDLVNKEFIEAFVKKGKQLRHANTNISRLNSSRFCLTKKKINDT